jgi:hypothetical protein
MLANGHSTYAHGALDQSLQGDADCNVFNYTASVTQTGGQRQEFVPTQAGLVSISVCIQAPSGPTEVDVIIRTGTANAPGAAIGGGSVVADEGASYDHVDFAAPIAVIPGTKYVIELATAGLDVTWRGTEFDQESYPAGSSSHPAVVRDFAFRTYSGALPATPTLAAKSPTPTRTRTPTRTATIAPTLTPVPTLTPPPTVPPAQPTPPPQSTAAPAGATPGQPSAGRAQASPTRSSGVLGGARRVGTIKPPDVGSRSEPAATDNGERGLWAALAITSACISLLYWRFKRRRRGA